MEDKEFFEPDPNQGIHYDSIKEAHVPHILSEEDWSEVERGVKNHSMATFLTTMRIKSGISQRVMATALHCRQPRISEIESTPNDKMSMSTVLKYVEVTRLPFEAELEDGRTIIVKLPKKKRRAPVKETSSC